MFVSPSTNQSPTAVVDTSNATAMLNEPPAPNVRPWISVGIVFFLLSQILIPITYYLGDEPTSERFAWRMFSSVHMSSWNATVVALVQRNGNTVAETIPLESELQESFVKTVHTAQLDIVEPFMREIAQRQGVKEVRFLAQGVFPSGKMMKPIHLSLQAGGPLVKVPE